MRHLEDKHYCPECFSNSVNTVKMGVQQHLQSPRIVTCQNIHYDRTLSALIYKLVPGLFQREMNRVCLFWARPQNAQNPAAMVEGGSIFDRIRLNNSEASNCDSQENGLNTEDIFFSPDESFR